MSKSHDSGIARSALIVHAHPEPASFSTAQAHVAGEALRAQGYEVQTLDLYARNWNPVLDRGEFPPFSGAFKPQREQQKAVCDGALALEVASDLYELLRADLLVLSFPLWWFPLPAILKGWIDRVFVMGAVFGGEHGLFDQAALTGRFIASAPQLSYTDRGDARFYVKVGQEHFTRHLHQAGHDIPRPGGLSPDCRDRARAIRQGRQLRR